MKKIIGLVMLSISSICIFLGIKDLIEGTVYYASSATAYFVLAIFFLLASISLFLFDYIDYIIEIIENFNDHKKESSNNTNSIDSTGNTKKHSKYNEIIAKMIKE